MNVAQTIELDLKGTRLTLEMSDSLIKSVRSAFNLSESEEVTERHVKYYLISSMKNALGAQ
jgi:hypothetical protein